MFKRVPQETKNEILNKIKNGQKVHDVAAQYAISPKTIYSWLRLESQPHVSIVEMNRLRRENDELKRIIGIITLELERGKKNRNDQ